MGKGDSEETENRVRQHLENCGVSSELITGLSDHIDNMRKKALETSWTQIAILIGIIAVVFLFIGFCWAGPSKKPETRFDVITGILSFFVAFIAFRVADEDIPIDPTEIAEKIGKSGVDKELMGLIREQAQKNVPNRKKWLLFIVAVGIGGATILKQLM